LATSYRQGKQRTLARHEPAIIADPCMLDKPCTSGVPSIPS
jgi:hypothetical protein